MKIAVNTRLLIENKLDGIGWFTYETLKRITQKHKETEFVFIFDRPFSEAFIFSSNIKPLVIGPPTRHPVLWYLWFEYSIPKVIEREKPDIFLSPDGYLSLSINTPSIPIIHDINFFHRPKDLPFVTRQYYQKFFPKFAGKAVRIGTVSNYSKTDIAESYGIQPDRIDVMYNGANEIFKPVNEEKKGEIKEKYSNGADYFVFIGSLHPRKNVARLLLAFDEFKNEVNKDFKLIIVGEKFFKTNDIKETYNKIKHQNDIIFSGRLNPADLRDLIGASSALTFVPLFEGFGIPNIEAMYCDVPVITSNTTSIPEVVGDAGILVNPFSVSEIKSAMLQIVFDKTKRKKLIEKGRERRKAFHWDKTAEDLWKCIEKGLG